MKKYIIGMALLVTMATSCEKKLEITPPSNLTEEQIMELLKKDSELVLAPMVSNMEEAVVMAQAVDNHIAYKNFQAYNIAQSLRGNDIVYMPLGQTYYVSDYQMIDYRTDAARHQERYWILLYKHIYMANNILRLLPKDIPNDENGQKMKRYKAAALTMRAYAYTYLMWIYADDYLNSGKSGVGVPLYTTITQTPVDRSPSSEVWSQVIDDAREAVRLYKEVSYNAADKQHDFDGAVANMVLARAAITAGEWAVAAEAANEVSVIHGGWQLMPEGLYVSNETSLSGFVSREANTEVLLAYDSDKTKPGTSVAGTSYNGWMNIYGSGQGGEGGGYMAIDKRLFDQIPTTDYRKKNFLTAKKTYKYESFAGKGKVVDLKPYMNTKFAASTGQTPNTDNTIQDEIVMRTSEALLIKAEALLRSGDEGGARTTLAELISARTNGAVSSVSESGDALLKLIQLQSRIELWGENGSEFYNNKRWNIPTDRRGGDAVTNHTEALAQVYPNAPYYTFQIPLVEINYNSSITVQNP